MAHGRHMENRMLIWAPYLPNNANLGKKTKNHMQISVTLIKRQFWKIQDGGRPPFWKLLYLHISVNSSRAIPVI